MEGHFEIDLSEMPKEQYMNIKEIIDDKVPKQPLDELTIMEYVDSNHAHNTMTRRSIPGLIMFVGRTPVMH
eukprot:7797719-Ditylum_brightwellii.AAC.1